MATEKKKAVVAGLADMLSRSTMAILMVPTGMTVAEMTALRRKLRETGVEFHVVKNTLARRAAAGTGKEAIDPLLAGATGIVVGYGDLTAPAKALLEYGRATKTDIRIKGGILDRQLLTADEVRQLAQLPSREVMISRLMGGLQSPIVGLVWVLQANLAGLANVLQGRKDQLEQQATA